MWSYWELNQLSFTSLSEVASSFTLSQGQESKNPHTHPTPSSSKQKHASPTNCMLNNLIGS
jgi:hypothetical protein